MSLPKKNPSSSVTNATVRVEQIENTPPANASQNPVAANARRARAAFEAGRNRGLNASSILSVQR